MSDKRYHELHEWNESLEWKHGESLSIVPNNYRAVLVAFGVFVSFVTKAVLGDLGVLSEHSERASEECSMICGHKVVTHSKRRRVVKERLLLYQ
jgi:hypothetical protein